LRLLELKASNFTSYRDLSLPLGSGVVVVVGDNGSGKSSLFDMIYFALTGHSLRKLPLSEIIRKDQDRIYVKLSFEHNGKIYTISRGRKKSRSFLEISIDNEEIKGDIKEKQEIINEIIDEELLNLAVIHSGKSRTFFDLSDREQKDLVVRLFSPDFIDISKFSRIAEQKKKELIRERDRKEGTIQYLKKEIEEINKSMELYKEYSDYSLKELLDIEKEIDHTIDELTESKNKKTEEFRKIENSIFTLKGEIRQITNELNKFKKLSRNRLCPICGAPLDKKHIDKEVAKLNKRLENKNTQLKTLKKNRNQLGDEIDNIDSIIKDNNENLSITRKLIEIVQKRDATEREIKNKNGEIRRLEKEIKGLNRDIEIYDTIRSFFSSDGLINGLFKKILPLFISKVEKFLSIFGNINLYYENNWIVSFDNNRLHVKSLSTGQRRIVELCVILAINEILKDTKNIDFLILDELIDPLDDNNITNVNNAIRMSKVDTVFIVTHRADDIDYDDKIEVVLVQGESEVK